LHGFEAERHLFRCLISSIDFSHHYSTTTTNQTNIIGGDSLKTNSGTGSGSKDFHQIQLLKECLICSLNKSNFSTVICFAFENSVHFQDNNNKLNQLTNNNNNVTSTNNIVLNLSKILKLNRIQEIALACLLKNNSNREEIKQAAQLTLEQNLNELTTSSELGKKSFKIHLF